LRGVFPTAEPLLNAVDILMSIVLINGLFAVMFKTLPDTDISWRDVGIGALASTTLF
jgi:membrane protein